MAQQLYVEVSPTFSGEVVMPVLIDNGGTFDKKFNAHFKRLSREQNEELQRRLDARDINDAQVLDLVLDGWDGLVDVEGKPFVFLPENRAAAVSAWPNFEASIVLAYFRSIRPAIEKNFEAPLVT